MSSIELDALIEFFTQVQDIENKLKQLKELNDDYLVQATVAACLANCKIVESLKNHVTWSTETTINLN